MFWETSTDFSTTFAWTVTNLVLIGWDDFTFDGGSGTSNNDGIAFIAAQYESKLFLLVPFLCRLYVPINQHQ